MRAIGTFLIFCAAIAAGVSSASAQTGAAAASLVALAPGGTVPVLESDVLGVVPENAHGVILGGNLLESKATLEKVMRKLSIPFDQGDDYGKFTQFLESLRGWDAKSMHAWAFVPGEGADDVEFVVFVPVTSYKDFAASLGAENDAGGPSAFQVEDGPDGYIASKGGFAVLVEKGDEDVLTKVIAAKKGVSDVGPAVRTWVGKHQIAGLILPAGMAKIFDKMLEGLDEIKKQVGAAGNEAAMVAGVFDVYVDLVKAGRDEVTMFAFGAKPIGPTCGKWRGIGLQVRQSHA